MNYLVLVRYPRSAADEIRGRLSTHLGPRSENVSVCKIVSGGGLKDLMAGFFPHILLRNLNSAVFLKPKFGRRTRFIVGDDHPRD
jgi:hypothetical protein